MSLDPNKNAVQLVDQAIKDISGQQLVSTSEMTDLLLDIRLYLLINEQSTPSNSTTIN
jgi:hypothetical protein